MNESTPQPTRDPRLQEIESRQDRLLRELDRLNERIEHALAGLSTPVAA